MRGLRVAGSKAVVSAVDPLARRSAPWVNGGRNGFRCSGVELSIRRWVNIIAHRSSSSFTHAHQYAAPPHVASVPDTLTIACYVISLMCTTKMNQALGEHEDFFTIRSEDFPILHVM